MNAVKDYMEAHEMQTRDAADVIEEFGDEISNMCGKCIDIGCGPGSVTRRLVMPKLPIDASVIGSDISKKMIDFARTAHADEKRLSFIELDIQTEALPKNLINAYDNAVSFYCLHWCPNIRRVFENMHQILRPGSKSLVLFIANNSGFDSYLSLYDNPEYKPYMKDVFQYIPYFHNCKNPRATLKKILEESGFEVLHCSCREKTYIYKNALILKKHALAINPFIERMPKAVREKFETEFISDVLTRKISIVNTDNGSKEECKIMDRFETVKMNRLNVINKR